MIRFLDLCLYIQSTFSLHDCMLLQYNLIPKAEMSLKVLAELPIIVVLMYQLYKQHVHNDVAEFIPLIMNTIVLQPTPQQRSSAYLLNVFSAFLKKFCMHYFCYFLCLRWRLATEGILFSGCSSVCVCVCV